MPLLSDESLAAEAAKRASYRLAGITTKLNVREVADMERLAARRGLQRGELIRQLILDELARDSGESPVSLELIEIVGIRLMLSNFLTPIATGQKLTPEIAEQVLSETRKRKRGVAVELSREVEGR